MLKIALLGAPGTGAGKLADALQAAADTAQWLLATVEVFTGVSAPQAKLAGADLVLLMGLEFPMPCASPVAQALDESADQSLRQGLADTALSYRVLYGTAPQRLAAALQAIESLLPRSQARPPGRIAASGHAKNQKTQPWVWMCDKCSDPQCEHRLLTNLLAQRASKAAA